jgi:hypothetical protein
MTTIGSPKASTGTVRAWLRAEGVAVLALSLVLYWRSGFSWWLFVCLLLVPDISMLLYLVSPRAGSISYNIVHSYVLPLGVVGIVIYAGRSALLPFAWIWTAHIGMDRVLGYGLKYPTSFQDTHLGTIGKSRKK